MLLIYFFLRRKYSIRNEGVSKISEWRAGRGRIVVQLGGNDCNKWGHLELKNLHFLIMWGAEHSCMLQKIFQLLAFHF